MVAGKQLSTIEIDSSGARDRLAPRFDRNLCRSVLAAFHNRELWHFSIATRGKMAMANVVSRRK